MPSYVKYCVESAQKTLSISDYPVPLALGKAQMQRNLSPPMLHLTPTMTQNHQLIQNQKPSESPEEVEALPQPSAPQLASVVTQPEPIVIRDKGNTCHDRRHKQTEPVAETETKDEVETVAKPTDEITVTPAETATDGSNVRPILILPLKRQVM